MISASSVRHGHYPGLARQSVVTIGLVIACLAGCKSKKQAEDPRESKREVATEGEEAASSVAGSSASEPAAAKATTDADKNSAKPINGKVVEIVTSKGKLTIELNREKAPKSSENFLRYVQDKHYDGTIFHRVIPNFMIQGGGFDGQLTKKETRAPIQNEADNGLKNLRGTIAMARTANPHSASAQFFINVKDNDFLNHRDKTLRGWGYTVFGKVTAGMDVADAISKAKTGAKGPFAENCPLEEIVLSSARIVR